MSEGFVSAVLTLSLRYIDQAAAGAAHSFPWSRCMIRYLSFTLELVSKMGSCPFLCRSKLKWGPPSAPFSRRSGAFAPRAPSLARLELVSKVFLKPVLVTLAITFVVGCGSSSTPSPAAAREVGNPGGLPTEASRDTVEKRYRAQEEILRRQQEEAARQDREIEELKLQQYQNEHLREYQAD